MDETKVQIGEDVLLDIGIHSDWYISSIGYDGESVDVALRRKADRNKEWWLADTPQPDIEDEPQTDCDRKCVQTEVGCESTDCPYIEYPCDVCDLNTDCPWK